jgi:hypothetical protein
LKNKYSIIASKSMGWVENNPGKNEKNQGGYKAALVA